MKSNEISGDPTQKALTDQRTRRSGEAVFEPVYNERGVIAENYYDLQGLGVLDAAREVYPLPKATGESTLRAVFQSVEIALVNLNDIMGRATADLERGAIGSATVKMFWARGFHRVLTRLSLLPLQLAFMYEDYDSDGVLRIKDSPGFTNYLETLLRFDQVMRQLIKSGDFQMDTALAEKSLESAEFNLVHLIRLCNHESTIWERNLAEVHVPAPVPSYAEFVVAQGMRDAVYDRVLKGDTYFTQFRGLHQIPETLGEEINDRCERAILSIRSSDLQEAVAHLNCINILLEGVIAPLPPMADNLATSDYHDIRENLGLTSGSHSICLRFSMFTDLYTQLTEELTQHVVGRPAKECAEKEVEEAYRRVDSTRFEDSTSWLLHTLVNECLRFRSYIFQWRDEHLHMPRNNLGGESTKSLTGSPDAVKAVKHMRDSARAKDPMLPVLHARGLANEQSLTAMGELTQYLESESSLDNQILAATGHVTQNRFHDVQERLGFFANRCPFSPPPKRKV
jgi:tryptophan 2,3-dioxygenase